MKARELGRDRVVPGDRVDIVGDTSGDEGSLSRIVRIQERRTVLRRTADDTDPVERIIVANADQLVIVTALADPEPRTRMIDRCVAAAYDARMDALLALTKADLADPATLVDMYAPIGVQVVVSSRGDGRVIDGLEAIRDALDGRTSVLVGHSGRGQVDARERAGPRHGSRGRRRERRDRPRSAHLELRGRAAGARDPRADLGHRHPGRAVVRARARGPAAPARRVRRPGRGGRGVPARLHARRRRPRLRARRVGAGLARTTRTKAARAARVESFRRLLASRLGTGEPEQRESARP